MEPPAPSAASSTVPDRELDAWLVGRALGGDLEAYEALVRRHRDRIFRIALRVLGDRSDAEDVAQEVVLQLWTGPAAFSGTAAFTTWLYRVVVNRCLDLRRRRGSPPGPVPGPDEPGHPVEPAVDRRVADRLRLVAATRAVSALPDEQRVVFVLHQLEGLSYREVAAVLHISEASVRGRLARARISLTRALREWV